MIEVAGLQVPRAGMIEIAHRLVLSGQVDTASRVLQGLVEGSRISLSPADREVLLMELEEPPAGLEQLRAVLRDQQVGRLREGSG